MILLAIDSSQQNGSFTLARVENQQTQVIEIVAVEGGTFSAQLIPQLAAALDRNHINKKEIGALAACVGPGSFTGLRIGLAGVKALAEVMQLPIVAVSALELLARKSEIDGLIFAGLDARRDEVFLGEYRRNSQRVSREQEHLYTGTEFAKRILEANPAVVLAGDERIAALARTASKNVWPEPQPGSADLARVAAEKLAAGETITVDALDANYLRRDENLFFTSK